MSSEKLIAEYLAIVVRLELSDRQASAATGLAEHTVRLLRLARVVPRRQRCVDALERFVAANKGAKSVSDVRLAVAS